jgi:hypothetical protein
MGVTFTETDNTDKILKELKLLQVSEIQGGVFGDKDANLPVYASANEFGTQDGRIPERAFLRKTFDDDNAIREVFDFGAQIYDKTGDIKGMLKAMGLKLVAEIQKSIDSNIPPPNAPSTIKAKGGKNKTLIDTGRMRQGITFKIV